MESTGISIDRTLPPPPLTLDVARSVVVAAQVTAALAVGATVSIGGMMFAGIAGGGTMSYLPWSNPLRLAVPLFVVAVTGAALVGVWAGDRRRSVGWALAAVGSVVACAPVLATRLSYGHLDRLGHLDHLLTDSTTTLSALTFGTGVTLVFLAGAGIAVGGLLIAAPVGPRSLVPAGFAVGMAVRAAVNPWWQTRLSVLAAVTTVLAAAATYGYAWRSRAASGATTPAARPAIRPWVPAAVLLGAELCALWAQTATDVRYNVPITSIYSDFQELPDVRLGLITQVLIAIALVGALAAYAARRWGAAAIRVLCVGLVTGAALGTQTVVDTYPPGRVTGLVAVGAAAVTVLATGATLGRRGVPWDVLGLVLAVTGIAVSLDERARSYVTVSPGMVMITVGLVMALTASVGTLRGLSGSARGMLVAFGVAAFLAGVRAIDPIVSALVWSDPQAPPPATFQDQLRVVAMAPLVAAVIAAGVVWAVRTRRTRPVSDSAQ